MFPKKLAMLFALSALACGGAQLEIDDAAHDEVDRREKVIHYRVALAQLRGNEFAPEAEPDLARAESWLMSAERRGDDEDTDAEDLDVLLDAVRGQLVKVRAYFGKRAAERGLEAARADYESQRRTAAAMRAERGASRISVDDEEQNDE